MTYTFTFDARFCSGCKACQAACKDKNNLPTGVLWRRVYEVTGGAWQPNGDAWTNSIFAYNLSISCNHCTHPKCAGVCPVDAYDVRSDGLVILDTAKCVGCGYCAWACPYGAPQYNEHDGTMTKCDFCVDNLEQGLHPACVAACPLRVLNFGEAIAGDGLALWEIPAERHPYPLPNNSRTQPHLLIKPHAAMDSEEQKSVANFEEIQPRLKSDLEDVPLILFTLLLQMAVGGYWAMTWMFPSLWALIQFDSTLLRLLPSLLIGASVGIGMLASFAHLGTKKNAWRVLSHVRKSWLSREILFTGLFGTGWLIGTLNLLTQHSWSNLWTLLTSLLGLCLVHSMAQVYRLKSAPGWNTWRTNAGFLISALLLGISLMTPLLAYESKFTGIQVSATKWTGICGCIFFLLVAQAALASTSTSRTFYQGIRFGLILIGMALTAFGPVRGGINIVISALIFLIVILEEAIGRWGFYGSRLEQNI